MCGQLADPGYGLNPWPAAWRARPRLLRPSRIERNPSVNKAQLIQAVAKTTGKRAEAADAVEAVLDAMVRAVAAGDVVSVTGFGSLTPEVRPARTARNPQTGEPVEIAERRVVKFRPGARFQDLVAGRRAMPESGNCIQKDPKTPRP
ncbi:HU family DNA-binding protein [Streptomyces sp. NBRC 110028]|uniref:HU family DNA-binding protein n=1 Tax=Streptomyces sp. NBRC 110028 TaxID=1621260 RepID=UPI00099EF92B